MLELATGWQIEIDYSPEWLFFRLLSIGDEEPNPSLSEMLWSIAEKHGINRLVFELADSALMNSYLVGQLVVLHKRAHLDCGRLRLCGFSVENHRVLRTMRFDERLPNYATREDAVMGYQPRKPR